MPIQHDGGSLVDSDTGAPVVALSTPAAGVPVLPQPSQTGLSVYKTIDLDETEEDVKTSAGRLHGWHLFNLHSATLFVKLYNATAANVVVGTTVPVMVIPVAAGGGANVGFQDGITFSTAICAACTTGVADNDTGAPAANVLVASFLYR